MNLKFNIYTANFNSSAVIDFTELTGLSTDSLLLMADVLTSTGTSCVWTVSLDGGGYVAINPYEDLDLLATAQRAKLRATFTTNGDMSPIMATDSAILTAYTTGLSGSYISRNVELVQAITTVKQTYDAFIPSGCSVTPQFSYDNGATWQTPTQTSAVPISAQYTRYTCTATISSSVNALNFRARLNITSNSPTLRPTARNFANVMK
jgi:hypothetical protein